MEELLERCQETGNLHSKEEDMTQKLPEVDEKSLGVSPFIQELTIETTKRIDPVAMIPDEDGIMLPATDLIEKVKAIKVYRIAGSKERAMGLSAGALRMLVYIQYTVKEGKDWLQMTPEQYERVASKGSRNVYKKAVDELWRYGYIFPTMQKHVYWVNPSLMFAGSRKNKWPDKVVIKNTWAPHKKDEI